MSSMDTLLTPAQRRHRVMALALLLAVLAVGGWLLHALWWTPWTQARAQADQIAQRQARAQALLGRREAIETALAGAEEAARQQPLWLPDRSAAQAVDSIARRVDQAVAMVGDGGRRCRVQSRNPVGAEAAQADRATLALRLSCGNAELLQLLHLLESGQPLLQVDLLDIAAPPQYPGAIAGGAAGVLDVGLQLSGQLAPAGSGAAR